VSSFAACSAPRSGCPPSTSPQRSPTSKLFSLSPSVLLRPASPTASIAVGSSSKTNLVSVQSPPLFEDFRPKPSILSPRRRCKRLARMTLRSFTPKTFAFASPGLRFNSFASFRVPSPRERVSAVQDCRLANRPRFKTIASGLLLPFTVRLPRFFVSTENSLFLFLCFDTNTLYSHTLTCCGRGPAATRGRQE
jgi:hypothetical protein